MRISIKSESYINCPAPKLSKKMFDWFWTHIWNLRLEYYTGAIETIDIRLNQALPYYPVHFYITVNGVYEFHRTWDLMQSTYMQKDSREANIMLVIDKCARKW